MYIYMYVCLVSMFLLPLLVYLTIVLNESLGSLYLSIYLSYIFCFSQFLAYMVHMACLVWLITVLNELVGSFSQDVCQFFVLSYMGLIWDCVGQYLFRLLW